jgi:hypothetical protein
LSLGLVACDRSDGAKSTPVPSLSQPIASASSPSPSAPSASASASAAASDNAQVPGIAWSGDYSAKKTSIELPKKINDETWKKDPGDKAIGPGKLTLSVSNGVAIGSATGSLGEQIASGTFDGKSLLLSLIPKDPTAPLAMTGTVVGDLADGVIKGTVRCSGPDAVVVREASFELRQSK